MSQARGNNTLTPRGRPSKKSPRISEKGEQFLLACSEYIAEDLYHNRQAIMGPRVKMAIALLDRILPVKREVVRRDDLNINSIGPMQVVVNGVVNRGTAEAIEVAKARQELKRIDDAQLLEEGVEI